MQIDPHMKRQDLSTCFENLHEAEDYIKQLAFEEIKEKN